MPAPPGAHLRKPGRRDQAEAAVADAVAGLMRRAGRRGHQGDGVRAGPRAPTRRPATIAGLDRRPTPDRIATRASDRALRAVAPGRIGLRGPARQRTAGHPRPPRQMRPGRTGAWARSLERRSARRQGARGAGRQAGLPKHLRAASSAKPSCAPRSTCATSAGGLCGPVRQPSSAKPRAGARNRPGPRPPWPGSLAPDRDATALRGASPPIAASDAGPGRSTAPPPWIGPTLAADAPPRPRATGPPVPRPCRPVSRRNWARVARRSQVRRCVAGTVRSRPRCAGRGCRRSAPGSGRGRPAAQAAAAASGRGASRSAGPAPRGPGRQSDAGVAGAGQGQMV